MPKKNLLASVLILFFSSILYGKEPLDPSVTHTFIELDKASEFAEFSVINSGRAELFRSAKNRKNIIVAVNAGHGTKGGTTKKTFCHPDKSPKIISGSASKGALQAYCVTMGMTFIDGTPEHEANLKTAECLKEKLLDAGYDVLMLRTDSDVQLDNVARVVICNQNADIHVSIHYDAGGQSKSDKGAFVCFPPEELKNLPNVRKTYDESIRLGNSLLEGLREESVPIYLDGHFLMDLTQNSYSTIPSITVELGDIYTETTPQNINIRAEGLLKGINRYFKEN